MTKRILVGGVAAAVVLTAGFAIAESRGMEGMMRGDGPRMDFATLDADGDGSITADDIAGLREQRFAALDADGDGQVSRQEFVDHSTARAGERAGTMFDRMDVDGDGTLSRDAVEARQGSGPDAARLIARFDSDGDGAISEDEFESAQARVRDRMGDRMGRGDRMMGGEGMMPRGGHGWRHGD